MQQNTRNCGTDLKQKADEPTTDMSIASSSVAIQCFHLRAKIVGTTIYLLMTALICKENAGQLIISLRHRLQHRHVSSELLQARATGATFVVASFYHSFGSKQRRSIERGGGGHKHHRISRLYLGHATFSTQDCHLHVTFHHNCTIILRLTNSITLRHKNDDGITKLPYTPLRSKP